MKKIITVTHEDPKLTTFMIAMHMASAAIKFADAQFSRKLDLSMIKYVALKGLIFAGGTMKHTDLARWTNTEKHNITARVARMKKEDLVTTERSTKDTRVVGITITRKGRETFKKASPVARNIMETLMSGIDEKAAAKFEKILNIVKANIEQSS